MNALKKVIETDPTKHILTLMREDMKQAREPDQQFQHMFNFNNHLVDSIQISFLIHGQVMFKLAMKMHHSNHFFITHLVKHPMLQ